MNAPDEGGSAFPQPVLAIDSGARVEFLSGYGLGGMTLRDYFAGKALAAILAGPGAEKVTAAAAKKGRVFGEHLAEEAYLFADAMLAERSKVKP